MTQEDFVLHGLIQELWNGIQDGNGAFYSQRPIIKEKTKVHNWEPVI